MTTVLAHSILEQIATRHAPMIERLCVQDFHRMLATGILREGAPIELIDGLLVRKDCSDRGGDPMVHGPRHAFAIKRLQRLALRLPGLGCHLQCQLPLMLADHSQPEPDAAIIRGEPEDYADHHPGPADTLAVIEIADSSLDYDRTTKQRIYATAGIPAYWLVDLADSAIEAYASPSPTAGRYLQSRTFHLGDTLRLEFDADRSLDIPAAQLLA